MTAHKSKGLEFPVVILADMNSGLVRWDGPTRYVDSARGLAAQRPLGWAPHDLTENEGLELQRDREEAWRLAYVAATRALDLLVVAATGDEIREESWFSPLYPALYPRRGQGSHPDPLPRAASFLAATPSCEDLWRLSRWRSSGQASTLRRRAPIRSSGSIRAFFRIARKPMPALMMHRC